MNATAILEKLQEEAKENAAAILQDANDRAEKMRTASDAKIASAKADMEKKAKADGLWRNSGSSAWKSWTSASAYWRPSVV